MQESKIFYTDIYKKLEERIKDFLNEQVDYLTAQTINSPRAVGDAIENILVKNFKVILEDIPNKYSSQFTRRAMADLAFKDEDDFYYVVDVKTQRMDAEFSMPNLISVRRLSKFYEDDKNYFVVLKADYKVADTKVLIERVVFVPIEFLSWECLTIGALGWGQIQIANASKVVVSPKNKRRDWMMEMCDRLFDFYPKEIIKIQERIDHFKRVKRNWQYGKRT